MSKTPQPQDRVYWTSNTGKARSGTVRALLGARPRLNKPATMALIAMDGGGLRKMVTVPLDKLS